MEAGVYASRDNITNFKIRVVLRKVTSSALPQGIIQEAGRASALEGSSESEAWVFHWQEKVFSQAEDELFSDSSNCLSPLHHHYHELILKQRQEGSRPNNRLFCLTDNDLSDPRGRSQGTTFVSKHYSNIRRRRPRGVGAVTTPTHEQRVAARINTPPTHSMVLLADLRRQDGFDAPDEVVLCRVTTDSRGQVRLTPDFTRGNPSLRIENRHKEVFEYRLEDVSDSISNEQLILERRVQQQVCRRHGNSLRATVGERFINPPEDEATRVCIHGNIESASGFDNDGLYVRASLELPEGWESEQLLNPFFTQLSHAHSHHLRDVAHFSCPFEYELISLGSHAPWPRLLVEVGSLDYWDRHRVEGYGFTHIPDKSGAHHMTIDTWRPAGRGLLDHMRRFFVGGDPPITDPAYIATPPDTGDRLSRYGFSTVSSGQVAVQLYVIRQSSLLVRKERSGQPQPAINTLVNAKLRASQLAQKFRQTRASKN